MKFKNWLEADQQQPGSSLQSGIYGHRVGQTPGRTIDITAGGTLPHIPGEKHVDAKNPLIAQAATVIRQYIDHKVLDRNPLNSNQALSGMAGTPAYMAPEMAARLRQPQYTQNNDVIEEMCGSLTNLLPMQKASLDRVGQSWRAFRDAVYARLNESWFGGDDKKDLEKIWGNVKEPWWGRRSTAPNPALYDVAIQRVQSLKEPMEMLNRLFQQPDQSVANEANLYAAFARNYQAVVPGVVAQLEVFRKNTPRMYDRQ